MATNYEELIAGVCAAIKCTEPERVLKGEPIHVNDIMFSLIHKTDIDEDKVFLLVDFGRLPKENEAVVLEKLMLENHASFEGNGPGFGLSPVTGKVIFCHHVSLKNTTGLALAARMKYLADIAVQWRQTYFLDQPRHASPATEPSGNRHRSIERRY